MLYRSMGRWGGSGIWVTLPRHGASGGGQWRSIATDWRWRTTFKWPRDGVKRWSPILSIYNWARSCIKPINLTKRRNTWNAPYSCMRCGVLDLLPAYSLLARLKLAQDQRAAAQQLLPGISPVRQATTQPLAYARAAAERIRLLILLEQGQPDPARLRIDIQAWIADRHLHVDDDLPYAREFEYGMLARALVAIAAVDAAHGLLQRLMQQAEAGERHGDLMEYLAVDALARPRT